MWTQPMDNQHLETARFGDPATKPKNVIYYDELDAIKNNPLSYEAKKARGKLRTMVFNDRDMFQILQKELRSTKVVTNIYTAEVLNLSVLEKIGVKVAEREPEVATGAESKPSVGVNSFISVLKTCGDFAAAPFRQTDESRKEEGSARRKARRRASIGAIPYQSNNFVQGSPAGNQSGTTGAAGSPPPPEGEKKWFTWEDLKQRQAAELQLQREQPASATEEATTEKTWFTWEDLKKRQDAEQAARVAEEATAEKKWFTWEDLQQKQSSNVSESTNSESPGRFRHARRSSIGAISYRAEENENRFGRDSVGNGQSHAHEQSDETPNLHASCPSTDSFNLDNSAPKPGMFRQARRASIGGVPHVLNEDENNTGRGFFGNVIRKLEESNDEPTHKRAGSHESTDSSVPKPGIFRQARRASIGAVPYSPNEHENNTGRGFFGNVIRKPEDDEPTHKRTGSHESTDNSVAKPGIFRQARRASIGVVPYSPNENENNTGRGFFGNVIRKPEESNDEPTHKRTGSHESTESSVPKPGMFRHARRASIGAFPTRPNENENNTGSGFLGNVLRKPEEESHGVPTHKRAESFESTNHSVPKPGMFRHARRASIGAISFCPGDNESISGIGFFGNTVRKTEEEKNEGLSIRPRTESYGPVDYFPPQQGMFGNSRRASTGTVPYRPGENESGILGKFKRRASVGSTNTRGGLFGFNSSLEESTNADHGVQLYVNLKTWRNAIDDDLANLSANPKEASGTKKGKSVHPRSCFLAGLPNDDSLKNLMDEVSMSSVPKWSQVDKNKLDEYCGTDEDSEPEENLEVDFPNTCQVNLGCSTTSLTISSERTSSTKGDTQQDVDDSNKADASSAVGSHASNKAPKTQENSGAETHPPVFEVSFSDLRARLGSDTSDDDADDPQMSLTGLARNLASDESSDSDSEDGSRCDPSGVSGDGADAVMRGFFERQDLKDSLGSFDDREARRQKLLGRKDHMISLPSLEERRSRRHLRRKSLGIPISYRSLPRAASARQDRRLSY